MTSIILPSILLCLLQSDKLVSAVSPFSDSMIISELRFESISTFMKTKGDVLHIAEDIFVPGNILYSDDHTLMTTDGKTAHLVVGSEEGYMEGRSSKAMFKWIDGFLHTNSTHVLIVDNMNHCLRYVNRLTNQTSQFVGRCTKGGNKDGYFTDALFQNPYAVIKDVNNLQTVIVTDVANKALRSVALNKGEVKTLVGSLPDDPYGLVFDSNAVDILVTLSSSFGKFNTKTLKFSALTKTTNKEGLDGDFTIASFISPKGILQISHALNLVADRDSNKIRIVDMKKKAVTSICDGRFPSDKGLITQCSLTFPHSLFLKSDTLYIGEHLSIRKIQVKFTVPCTDINVSLSAGEQMRCILIMPGHHMCYPPGIYRYRIEDRNCSIAINVNKGIVDETCPDSIIKVADAETLKAEISLLDGHEMTLPVGTHLYRKKVSDRMTCQIAVHVLDPRLKNRLDISANYQLSCAQVNDFKAIILSVAKLRYNQIKQISSGYCNQSAEYDVMMSCASNVLHVLWPTDCVFNGSSVKQHENFVSGMKEYIRKSKSVILELVIPNQIPPIIEPMVNKEGLPATVALTQVCMGGLQFMNATQTCQ